MRVRSLELAKQSFNADTASIQSIAHLGFGSVDLFYGHPRKAWRLPNPSIYLLRMPVLKVTSLFPVKLNAV